MGLFLEILARCWPVVLALAFLLVFWPFLSRLFQVL